MRALLLLVLLALPALAQEQRLPDAAPQAPLPIGITGRFTDVVLPGPELEVAPVDSTTPVVIRITAVQPHGTAGFRYDLEVYGLEAGRHDLTRWLRPRDGSLARALPPLALEVDGAAPPGALPADLRPGALPRVGGYRRALVAAGLAWGAGLVALVLVGRRRARATAAVAAPPTPRARLARLLAALRPDDAATQAEVERLIIDAWRERLGLHGLAPQDAMARLRAHPDAGAALARLEGWLHRPAGARAPLGSDELARLVPERQEQA